MLSSLNFKVKTQQYFVNSSDMFLEKNTLLEIWLNLELNLQCNHFRGFVSHSQALRAKREDHGNEVEIVYMSNMARSFETVCAMQLYISDGIELAELEASCRGCLRVRIRRNQYEKYPWRLECCLMWKECRKQFICYR